MIEHLEKQWLSAYLDGELDTAQSSRVQTHLSTCAECQAYLDELQGLQQQLRQLNNTSVAIDVQTQVLALLPERSMAPQPSGWSVFEYGAAAASVACGLFIGSFILPAEPAAPVELAVMQTLSAHPPGSLCAISAHCYLEPGQ